jgi:membrane protease YdiL (CAAX protease family)
MLALIIVLAFPLILTLGYPLAFLLTGRDRRVLLGPVGFVLYLFLLSFPLTAVLVEAPEMPAEMLVSHMWTPAWIVAGIVTGLVLWAFQRILVRRDMPTWESPIWVGPPGWSGFALFMLPVAYIVVAEEVVWRAYLMSVTGLLLSSAAFALHHYHFGARHVAFALLAGMVWGGLLQIAEELWPALASHMTYDVLAWAYLRRRASRVPRPSEGNALVPSGEPDSTP